MGEGDVWGDLRAVGREAGSLLRLLGNPTHPPPLPVREGAMPTPRPPVGGSEESEREDQFSGHQDRCPAGRSREEQIMATVRVEQRNAHLAGNVRLESVKTREEVAAPCARPAHRAPPNCAPVLREGDLWGDLNTVGRDAGSPLRLLETRPPLPNPFP